MEPSPPRWLGLGPLAFVAIHLALRVRAGHPEDALWMCHVADWLLGVGLLARIPRLRAIGTLWIFWGTPLWLLDVAAGGAFRLTSLGTHLGALAIAFAAARCSVWPVGTWWRALFAVWALLALTRLLVPPEGNLNLAFRVQDGWTAIFPSYPSYFAAVSVVASSVFFGGERLFGVVAQRGKARLPRRGARGEPRRRRRASMPGRTASA